jgi:TolA-binding protein
MSREQAAEDLLIRARRGELGEGEARRFEIAVQSSRELELLYAAGTEFDAQAELLPGDEQRMSALVAGALEELERTEPTQAMRSGRRLGRRRSDAWFFATSVGLGMLLSVALASAWQYGERRHWFGEAQVVPTTPTGVASSGQQTPTLPAAPVTLAESAAPAAVGSVPPLAQRSAVSGHRVDTKPFASSPPEPAPPSPAELFAHANESRRNGDRAAAILLYERLVARYPDSAEAEDARVLVGNLRLSQRSPGAALGEFEQYGAGALTPEALWGRARALRSLQSPDEREVLQRIVRDYPDSPYANGARRRLQQLSP